MALFVLKKKKTPGDNLNDHYVVFQSLSHVGLSVTPRTASTPGFRVLQLLPELAQTQVQWVGDAIQPSRPVGEKKLAF